MRLFGLLLFIIVTFARLSRAEEESPSYIDESLSFMLGKMGNIEENVGKMDQKLNEISTTVTVIMQHLLAQSLKEDEARRALYKMSQKVEDLHTLQHESRTEIKALTKSSEESLIRQRLDWNNTDDIITFMEKLLGSFQNTTSKGAVACESGFKAISTEIRQLSDSQKELQSNLKDHISRGNQKVNDNIIAQLEIVQSRPLCPRINATIVSSQTTTLMESQKRPNLTLMTRSHAFENCSTALKTTQLEGVYKILIPQSGLEPFDAYCLTNGWMLIQRRTRSSVDFKRDWNAYKHGFGDPHGDYWLGLEKVFEITSRRSHTLVIVLYDSEGFTRHSLYFDFKIGSERKHYSVERITKHLENANLLGKASREQEFLTYDRADRCGDKFVGAWWYDHCSWGDRSNRYRSTINGEEFEWSKTEMMINYME